MLIKQQNFRVICKSGSGVAVIDTTLEDNCNWGARPAEAPNIIAMTIEIRSSGNDKSDIPM